MRFLPGSSVRSIGQSLLALPVDGSGVYEGDAAAVVRRHPLDPADPRRRGEVAGEAADTLPDPAADLHLLFLGQIPHGPLEPE